MFKITKKVKCYYCNRVKLFFDMPHHIRDYHKGKSFLTVHNTEKRTCGECPYIFLDKQDLVKHYKICHQINLKLAHQCPEELIQNEVIDYIMKLQVSDLMYCRICDQKSYSMEDLVNHHKLEHMGREQSIDKVGRKLTFGCCRKVALTRDELCNHMKTCHPNSIKSSAKFDKLLSTIKLIFPNGFVCEKRDTIYSSYNNDLNIICDIFNKRTSEHFLDFDPARHCVSYYGIKPEKVDLENIFTTINIGSSTLRVSCLQLSGIFNINPVVNLEKL